MTLWLSVFLFLHVMGAIAVFGPTFVFPIIASQAQKSPQNFPFAARLSEYIERRVVLPGAIVQGITGVALIIILGADLTSAPYRWLVAGIILYLIAISFAAFVQQKNAEKMVHLMDSMPPGPPPAGGPPPEIAATAKALQQGGMLLTVLIVLIVILMVTKPSF